MRVVKIFNILLTCIILCHNALATIINIPYNYRTIVEGVEASINGDTVLVAPGVYEEDITFGGKNILLTSSHGPDTTYILGKIRFENEEDSTCVLRGFSITEQGIYSSIFCFFNTSPIIEGNIIKDHSIIMAMPAIMIFGSGCILRNNIIKNNSSMTLGGGIYIDGNGSKITKNIINGNVSYQYFGKGGGIFLEGNAEISYNLFNSNMALGSPAGAVGIGGGIFRRSLNDSSGGSTIIINNTFVNNVALNNNSVGSGGAIFFHGHLDDALDTLIITNNIVAYNISSGEDGDGVRGGPNDSMYFRWDYNCIYENTIYGFEPGEHDIFEDPMFVDTLNDDFHLLPNSPCIDAGDPESPLDPDSTRADIGAYFYDQTVSIGEPGKPTEPYRFRLHQNYPNPFNSQTVISYYLPENEIVSVKIFSITGQLVKNLVSNECQNEGEHKLIWDGRDRNGSSVTTGIYFYQLKIGGYRESKAMIVIR